MDNEQTFFEKHTNLIIAVAIVLVLAVIGYIILDKVVLNKSKNATKGVAQEVQKPESLCYYTSVKAKKGRYTYDTSSLNLDILNGNVTGQYNLFPALTSSKTGVLSGIINSLNAQTLDRTVDVTWNASMNSLPSSEKLTISLGDGKAVVNGKAMSQINCNSLDEIEKVGNYIKDNIGSIAVDNPTQGGTWGVNSVSVDPSTKMGDVAYQDGHTQSGMQFSYQILGENSIVVTKYINSSK